MVGIGYMLIGVLWIGISVIGKISYVRLAIGLAWILSGVTWLVSMRIWRLRAERSKRETGLRQHGI